MLRISLTHVTEADGDADVATVKLEGALLAAWHGEVRAACDAARATYVRVHLDFADVGFVDAGGVELIRSLLVQPGVSLGPCSNFVTELLHLERT